MSSTNTWHPDILGAGYSAATIPLGTDPDGEGEIAATLVRYAPTDVSGRPAILWVHGMTDYFFQTHVAEFFHAQGFAFYAIDLRKCGRSRRTGQHWHYISDFSFYFEDLDAATTEISSTHPSLTPMAHSTAGIIVPLWLDYRRRTGRLEPIHNLILNSPWLDMMGISPAIVKVLRPLVNVVGKRFPLTPFPGGRLTAAGESIHKDYHGEWDYNLVFKPLPGHRKYLGWLRAVLAGQARIHHDDVDVGVPTLVLGSTRSHFNAPYSPLTDVSDAVIDVRHIQKWAPHLGKEIDVHPIQNARHDVFLSLAPAREEAFRVSTDFLRATT